MGLNTFEIKALQEPFSCTSTVNRFLKASKISSKFADAEKNLNEFSMFTLFTDWQVNRLFDV